MSKFSQEIEVGGHLIDSSILTKIFDKIMDLHGEFQVEEIEIGKKKGDQSFARLLISGKNQKHLDELLETVYRLGAVS
ncbi:MAG: TIGR00300 family protein, partial [Nitrosopumilus sp.]